MYAAESCAYSSLMFLFLLYNVMMKILEVHTVNSPTDARLLKL